MTISNDPIVIVSAVRTPMGGFQGELKSLTAPQLGAAAIRAAVERAGVAPDAVEEVLFGCVLSAGLGQAPARQAALGAGLDKSTRCTTLNKMCGSGMEAAILAHDMLVAGSADVVVAGGMESMSNAPYLLDRARSGYRMGHGRVLDHMFLDGLEDAYDKGRLMGTFAEDCAETNGFTREAQDAFAIASTTRAQQAIKDGSFKDEIVPLTVTVGKEQVLISNDEQPPKAKLDKIASLETGVPRRRHGDGGELQLDLRWRCGTGVDAPFRSRKARPETAGSDSRPRGVCRHPGPVPGGTGGRDQEADEENRLVAGRSRSGRSQRSLRRGQSGDHDQTGNPPREDQRSRRRLRPRPPDRCVRRADPRDLALGPAPERPETRRCSDLHRRR